MTKDQKAYLSETRPEHFGVRRGAGLRLYDGRRVADVSAGVVLIVLAFTLFLWLLGAEVLEAVTFVVTGGGAVVLFVGAFAFGVYLIVRGME